MRWLPWALGGAALLALSGGAVATAIAYEKGKALGSIQTTTVAGKLVEVQTAKQFLAMQATALKDGVRLVLNSGFRSMSEQQALHARYQTALEKYRADLAAFTAGKLKAKPAEPASTAKPGYSNHQNGIAIDIQTGGFGTAIHNWLMANAARFGFANTGASYRVPEPWHWERTRVVSV